MDLLPWAAALVGFSAMGCFVGFAAGLVPGIHPNTLATLLLFSKTAFLGLAAGILGGSSAGLALVCVFLVAAVVAHGVASFVPSVFLGAPGDATALSVLPGHRLLREGRGPEAVAVAAQGAVLGAVATAALLLPVRWVMGPPVDGYERARAAIPIVLAALVVLLILSEGPRRSRSGSRPARVQRLRAALLFSGSGALGWAVLATDFTSRWNWFPFPALAGDASSQTLLPLFTGLFGLSTVVVSLRGTAFIPRQSPRTRTAHRMRRAVVCGSLAGAAVSWLPGLSSGAATALAQFLARRRGGDEEPMEFMASLGSVGTATSVFTVAALFIIRRARSGVAVAIRDVVGAILPWEDPGAVPMMVLLILAAAMISSATAYPLAVRAAHFYARVIARLPYRAIAAVVAVALVLLVFVAGGGTGLIIAVLALPLGVLPPRWGVKRVHLMGALLVPVLALSA